MALNKRLIAHRGEPKTYPENSLLGYKTVINNGALYIETDIQLSADGMPFLCHDSSLKKATNADIDITQTNSAVVLKLSAAQTNQFDSQFKNLRLSLLKELTALLIANPQVTAFIEIKNESIDAFGIKLCVDTILKLLKNIIKQIIIISFNHDCLAYVKQSSGFKIGWVTKCFNKKHENIADTLQPDFLFIGKSKLPKPPFTLWQGKWQWAVYAVDDIEQVNKMIKHGFDFIETNHFSKLKAYDR